MWVTVVWQGQTAGPLLVGQGFIPTSYTDFLEPIDQAGLELTEIHLPLLPEC